MTVSDEGGGFTPGPWEVCDTGAALEIRTALDGDVDGDTGRHFVTGGELIATLFDGRHAEDDAALIAAAPDLYEAGSRMANDYQTSDQHHPEHVLVPLTAFNAMLAALSKAGDAQKSEGEAGSACTDSASEGPDGPFAGASQRKSEVDYAALGRACERHGLAGFADNGEMLFRAPDEVIEEQATAPLWEKIAVLKRERDDAIAALSRMCGDA